MNPGTNGLRGGCQCGAVRYEVTGTPYHLTLCHCTICQRTSGAPGVAWFSVESAGFRLLQGTLRAFRSSEHAIRSFCGDCGTPLTFQVDGKPEIDVTTCSLDDPERLPPEDQTFSRSRLSWMRRAHRLPAHWTTRSPGNDRPA